MGGPLPRDMAVVVGGTGEGHGHRIGMDVSVLRCLRVMGSSGTVDSTDVWILTVDADFEGLGA